MYTSFIRQLFFKKAISVPAIVWLLLGATAGAANCSSGQAHRISVLDFSVQSDNPQYKYLGKGFSEFISIELSKARNMALIDREKREEAFKEQAFTLSGAVDAKNSIELGKMLAADYLVTGKIFDLMGNLTVTFKVLNTATGEIAFEDKITDKLSKYEYISSKCSEKIVKHFDANATVMVARDIEKPQEAAIKFSKAVDAYDKKDFTAAKKELTEANKLDPGNAAVNVYINKLFTTTTRFKVMPELYVPYENPAYLGLLLKDKAYLTGSSAQTDPSPTIKPGEVNVSEEASRFGGGYTMPLKKGWGLGLEMTFFSTKDMIMGPPSGNGYYEVFANDQVSIGGPILSSGFKISENIAVGGGIGFLAKNRNYYIAHRLPDLTNNLSFKGDYYTDAPAENGMSFTGGLLLKNTANTLFLDSYYTHTTLKGEYYTVIAQHGDYVPYTMPAVQENTLTFAMNQKRTFLVLKQTNYIYSDLDSSISKFMPAIEQRLAGFVSLRAGAEFTSMKLNNTNSTGTGFTGGATVSLGKKWDFDVNASVRERQSRNLRDLKVKDTIIFFTLSRTGLFFKD
ncbi:MAG TPA: CsgG/HfaB family protein [Elusimicrobiales bacterium]|nr:CsgG/HfaB family protein [Elusimicrobiales bacterium]